ncbi:MAG: efflux RND transporter periplasmic adaptor subunit [Verrucomicrobiota bacterium JB022]|nr:efflux RND transporter periplasmic adaptor subunit [Verrucomicrobiota bacterium JB022]
MNVSIKPLMAVAGFFSALSLSVLVGCGGHGAEESAAHGGGGGAPSGQPMEVPVLRAQVSNQEWTEAYPGRAEGLREVQIRPRVSGILLERVYQEGSKVEAGDVLFKIDPQPFQVALMSAEAELARAEASLREAERNWNRTRRLYDSNAISERERDNALSTFELAQAELNVQKASVEEAKLQLGYTSVESIVPGVTSLEAVPQGSLVDSSTLLATVTQLDPVQVRFSISETDPIFAVLQQHRADAGSDLTARLRLDDGTTLDGKVDFAASTVNSNTGTVQYRALFENPDARILPGMFVRVSFADLTLENVVLIPETSVITSPQGPIVYTVGPDSTVQPRPVQLGPIFGNQQAIVSGLKEGDQVLTGAIIRVRPGMPIKPVVQQNQNQES